MTLPRPALLAILGVALIASATLALRSLDAGEDPAAPAPQAPGQAVAPGQRTARPPERPARGGGAEGDLPRPVARALARRRPIVLFFSQAGGADDAATRRSVRSLKADPSGAAVFSDRIENIASYRRIVTGLDVSQAPSIVILPPRREDARLLEGFIDEGSLRQQLVDALR